MQIEVVPVGDLLRDPANVRKHDTKNLESIKGSLKAFGQQKPIVVDKNGIVIAGNGTLAAAVQLGWETIAVVRSDLDGTNRTAYAIADNRTAELAEWDMSALADQLMALDELDFKLDEIGFDKADLDKMLPDIVPPHDGDEDEIPEQVETICKPGDLWILGEHRLLCGDSTDILQVERLMDGQKADMVFTDPPYNIDYENIKHPKFKSRNIKNDNLTSNEFSDFCNSFIINIKANCDGCIYIFGPPGEDGRILFSAADKMLHCSTTIIWNKDQFTLGRGKYQNKYEPCWFGWSTSGSNFCDDRTLTNVWDFARPKSSELHPTMKPIELIEYAISHASNKKNMVLDLFLGSGSTLIACEKTGRKCYGMEIDPHYCDIIIERWKKFAGKEAYLARDDGSKKARGEIKPA